MDDLIWNQMEFGLHNYVTLIGDAKARALGSQEDAEFVSSIRKYHSKNASVIDWGGKNMRDVLIKSMKGDSKNCDVYFKQAVRHLNLDPNELAWVGWHDQLETMEITVGKLLEYVIPALFVGYGTIVMSVGRSRYAEEQATTSWIHN